MKMPVHTNPTQEFARAPYNFVPLPETVVTIDPTTLPHQDRYHPDRHTGYIDCTITTASPTFVRAPLTLEEFAQQEAGEDGRPWREQTRNKPDFFYTDPAKTPRIPGSSLRGMLRQLVEIVGYGKMEWVSKAPIFTFRAVAAPSNDPLRGPYQQVIGKFGRNVRAGYLERHGDEWYVRPAQTPAQKGWPTTDEYVKVNERTIKKSNLPKYIELDAQNYRPQIHPVCFDIDNKHSKGGRYVAVVQLSAAGLASLPHQGHLVCSGNMKESSKNTTDKQSRRKKHALVLLPDLHAKPIKISQQAIEDYRAGLTPYQREMLVDWSGSRCAELGCLGDGKPIFFVVEHDQVAYFGHSPNFRIPARLAGTKRAATPLDFVPEVLRNEKELDLAEALFGFTKSTGPKCAYASRVLVGDAFLESGQSSIWLRQDGMITPKILAGPKPTTFQHYLVQDKSIGHDPDRRETLAHYGSSPTNTQVRGYKHYWHRDNVTVSEIEESTDKLGTQPTQMRPVSAGVKFRARIRFENLSDVELGALLWVLTLPGRPGQEYRHSIGMGKPYGMGAIKLDPRLTLEDRQRRYGALFDEAAWLEGSEDSSARIPEFVGAFDHFIRREIGAKDAATLADVERIQMLLKLLEWPGPDKELTRYMEIERRDPKVKPDKFNEYKGRPVLPDPLHIEAAQDKGQRQQASAHASGRSQGPRTSTGSLASTREPARPATVAPKSNPAPRPKEIELSHPTSIDEVVDGMYLEGKIVRVEPSRVVIDILGQEASLATQNVAPPPRDQYDLDERFPTGTLIKVVVMGRNKKGRLQVTMRRS